MISSKFLWLGRSFDERIVRTADHVAERSSGGDHRVDGVFLLNAEVQKHSFIGRARGTNRGHYVGARCDAFTANAKGIGKRSKIGRDERSSDIALIVEKFLPLAHHAKKAVVDNGDL